MRSLAYISRHLVVVFVVASGFSSAAAFAASAVTHEIVLKKDNDCDAALNTYVNHGQAVKKTYRSRQTGNRLATTTGKRSVEFVLGDTQP